MGMAEALAGGGQEETDHKHLGHPEEALYRHREEKEHRPDRGEDFHRDREEKEHRGDRGGKEHNRDREEKGHHRSRGEKEHIPAREKEHWRDREDKTHTPSKRRTKHESSVSDSSVSSFSEASTFEASSSDESSDERHRIRRTEDRRKKDRKRSHHHRSDRVKRKEDKSKSKKRKRRSKGDKDSDEDDTEREKKRRLRKEAKKILKRHKKNEDLTPSEHQAIGRKVDSISVDDYFLKSSEFATWLKEERGVYFSDLSSEETHKIFETFVATWNTGRLAQKYYDGITLAQRTNHNWAIKKGPVESLIIDEEYEYTVAKKKEKYERKKFQREQEDLLDEILPKTTGRERLLEKKAGRREQARLREDSPELMKERDVMGGGGDFQQRLAREKAHRERKRAEKVAVYNEKRSAFDEKEAAAMDQLRALVNVAGGKITIAKRGDQPRQ